MMYTTPRPRISRAILTKEYVDEIISSTPPLSKNSDKLFRDLRERGLISYTEFLFLLSAMTQPESASHNSFAMLDRKYNNVLTKGMNRQFYVCIM